MRIVGGRFRGRSIVAPAGSDTRPTSDRVREAMLNILTHGRAASEIEGAVVLDLYAGSGALGLEALSRGAAFCTFVEQDAEARGAIRANVEALGFGGITKILRRNATMLGEVGTLAPATLAFLDPPYGKGLVEPALRAAIDGGWLMMGATIVVEEASHAVVDWPAGVGALDRREWGDTAVHFARLVGVAGAG